MRNEFTDNYGGHLTVEYLGSGLTVDQFIDSQDGVIIQKEYLHEMPATSWWDADKYASFHKLVNGMVLQCYYWASQDAWFCKN